MKLQLKDVTLLAITKDETAPNLRALEISSEYIDFAEIVLMVSKGTTIPKNNITTTTWHMHDPGGPFMRNYINWSLYSLVDLVQTPYVLIVHPDGYVINPSAWRQEFLDYDYIGAKWPWLPDHHNVGNSGFNLRSRKLLEHVARINVDRDPDTPDDVFICRHMRPWLESCGIKFAPAAVADQFSYERDIPTGLTFGFHGFFNLWRENTDAEMLQLIDMMPPYVTKKQEYEELMTAYSRLANLNMVAELKARRDKALI